MVFSRIHTLLYELHHLHYMCVCAVCSLMAVCISHKSVLRLLWLWLWLFRKSCELIQSATFAIIILKYGHEKERKKRSKTHTKVKWNNLKPVMNEHIQRYIWWMCSWQQYNNIIAAVVAATTSACCCRRFQLNVKKQTTKAHYTQSGSRGCDKFQWKMMPFFGCWDSLTLNLCGNL